MIIYFLTFFGILALIDISVELFNKYYIDKKDNKDEKHHQNIFK